MSDLVLLGVAIVPESITTYNTGISVIVCIFFYSSLRFFIVAASMFFFWDYLITFDDEVSFSRLTVFLLISL